MKKWSVFLILCLMTFDLAGCATVQKKFTRKKKESKHIPAVVYFQEGPYQKKYSNAYYYKMHFTLWKSWHGELLNQLGSNSKKVTRCAQEALGHMMEMSRYLVPDKQLELKPPLDALTAIAHRIEANSYSDSEKGGIRIELEKIERLVANNFYYDKVKDQVLPETVDLGSSPPAK